MNRNLRPWRGTGIRPLDDLYKEVDGLVQHFFGDEPERNGAGFIPRLNVAETDAGYEVSVDLPGLKPEDVAVEMHDNQLTISGKRASETSSEERNFHRVERHYGEFRRVVSLPAPVEEDKITADYTHGVLTVQLPKSEKLKPTKIQVTAG